MKPSISIPRSIPQSAGGWIVIAVLLLLLGAAGCLAYQGLTFDNADVPTSSYVAMAFGVIFSLIVGIGLWR
jgi:hypothetical protein